MLNNVDFSDFRNADRSIFDADTVRVIHTPKTVIVQFFLFETDFKRREFLQPTLRK
ncbi:MAG: hypothetical protein ACJASB_003665 [Shewanella psychromarinicola]|jgi:hypothetical protein